ncbi:MAG: 3'-5' exonuclease [Eubacteriales bacterium]
MKTEYEDAQDRIDNIRELASNIIQYEEENFEDASLSGFLEEVSLMTDIDNYDDKADSVVMMTMHSAKGLEFPVVFLPGFEEGIFPGLQSIYNPDEIEEERRLAYVAITRAEEEVALPQCRKPYAVWFCTTRNKASRFLSEIPEELVERSRSRSWQKPTPGTSLPTSAYEAREVTTNSARNFILVNLPKAKSSGEKLAVGDKVKHLTFGQGEIISATPMGNDTLLEIMFETVGSKKIMQNFARLKKLS